LPKADNPLRNSRDSARRPLTDNQRNRRQRILEATRELVTQHGYEGTIMRDVATLADVSATTLYNLYHTKDKLLLAALREQVGRSARLAAIDAPRPGYRYLLAHAHHVADYTNQSPTYVAAISQALFRAAAGDALVSVLLGVLREDVARSLACMMQDHELIPSTDLDRLATLLTGAFWSTFFLWDKGLIKLSGLEATLQQNYLSLLIPCTQGPARTILEGMYGTTAES
jgi:AcrR family transcriptional regulator